MAADPQPVMADSGVWFDLYKGRNSLIVSVLKRLLAEDRVWAHADIIKEFALGRRTQLLSEYIAAMRQLPRVDELSINEFLAVVDEFDLRGSGRSRDTFLFASAIQHGVLMLTADWALQRKSERVGLCFLCDEGLPHQ